MESATNVGRRPQNAAEYLPTHGLTVDLSLACDDLSRRIQQTSARTAAEQNAAMPPPSQAADPESLKYIYTMRSVMKIVDSTIDDIQLRWGVARTFSDRGSLSSRGDGGLLGPSDREVEADAPAVPGAWPSSEDEKNVREWNSFWSYVNSVKR